MATRDDVLALVQGYQSGKLSPAQHVLLDVRDKGEWLGTTSSPYDKDGKDFAPKRVAHTYILAFHFHLPPPTTSQRIPRL